MIKVQLRSRVERPKFAGYRVKPTDAPILLEGDAAVYKPDGEPLVLLRRGRLSGPELERARPQLRYLKKYTSEGRATYGGAAFVPSVTFADGVVSKSARPKTADGTYLKTASAIVGYFDRMGGRFPYCRATRFTGSEAERWEELMPFTLLAAEEFKREMPERYRTQAQLAARCKPDYIIRGTPFSTLTVNNNVIAATHKDAGDYKDGFGLIAVARQGHYRGGWLVFPEYGVGVDLRDGDLLYFNSHDWHGMTPFEGAEEGHERISVVFYLRERMVRCGTPAEEIANAKKVRGGLAP